MGERLHARAGAASSRSGGPGARTIAVILAVSPPIWAELLGKTLSEEPGLAVVGAVSGEAELLAVAASCKEAVVVFDYEALGPGGEGIIARLRRAEPLVRVVVLARRSGEDTVTAVIRAGAAGLVGKDMSFEVVVRAIRAAADGEVWANRRLTAQVISQLIETKPTNSGLGAVLTAREWEVVDAVARGLRNQEIAHTLGIGVKTSRHTSTTSSPRRD